MIPDIKELNFPSYATLYAATATLPDMGEKTIEGKVRIRSGIVPDFTDWAVLYFGEKYVQPLRKPQGSVGSSLSGEFTLTFIHWAVRELQRYPFVEMTTVASGTAMADNYETPLSLTLGDFITRFAETLEYYYGDSIMIKLNPNYDYSSEPTTVSISNASVWEVLVSISTEDVYGVRWYITTQDGDVDKYIIMVGYDSPDLGNTLSNEFSGGLLTIERQVQDTDIKNKLLGRGGSQNLPYRYFKKLDKDNPTFEEDPDWIPELENIYFSELRGKTFRDYVRGWKAAHYGGDTYEETEAYLKGFTDEKFNPVEYVYDQESIDKYGEIWGRLDNNDDIYPTIQGITVAPYGRVDEVVAVEEVTSDDVTSSTTSETEIRDLSDITATATNVAKNMTQTVTAKGTLFSVASGCTANITGVTSGWAKESNSYKTTDYYATGQAEITSYTVYAVNTTSGEKHVASGVPEGEWRVEVEFTVKNNSTVNLDITVSLTNIKIISSDNAVKWGSTFDIWIKNIWGSAKADNESAEAYASRVWDGVLGDHLGSDAKVIFSTGWLSINEDYEFTIVSTPVYDTSKTLVSSDGNTYTSEWSITLAKSDAEYDATGLYLPNTKINAEAGDHFFFTGIELPHIYVLWAEEELDEYKTDQLAEVKDINPTWVLGIDKQRFGLLQKGESDLLMNNLIKSLGGFLAFENEQLTNGKEIQYIQSLTITYNEPTDSSANLIPDIDITLSEDYASSATTSSVTFLTSEIETLHKQVSTVANVESIIKRYCDKVYLRKDGFSDISISPTQFASLISGRNFRQGLIGGRDWCIGKDENGNSYLEIDRIGVRQEMSVNTMVINQTTAVGGKQVECAAVMEVSNVVQNNNGSYTCYFDQKGGSVKNLFVVDDVALSETYNPDNSLLKYYKRRVIAIGENYITLSSKAVNGTGIPEVGDTVLHYGSYTKSERQYVIVRDVLGGAYERYIEGLTSVNTDGTEYYFAGRQTGQSYRFFIGSSDSYMEYKDEVLNIKGNLQVSSTINNQSIEDYISNTATSAVPYTNRNYFLNSGFTNQLKHYTIYSSLTCAITNTITHGGNSSLYLKGEANNSAMYRSFYQRFDSVKAGSPIVFSVWAYFNTIPTTRAVRFIFEKRKSDGTSAYSNLYLDPTTAGEWQQFSIIGTLPDDCTSLLIWLRLENEGDEVYISSPKLEYDSKVTEWIAAPEDISELNAAVTDAAATAQQTADAAKERIASWADDGVVSPVEKKQVYQEVLALLADKNELLKQGTCYGIGLNGNYLNAFNAYYNELYAIYTSTDDVVTLPDDFKTVVNTYYTERTTQVEQIANAAKDYVDTSIANIDVDVDTLTDLIAREQTTSVTGGLILTSKIKVGTGNTTNDDGTVTQTTTKAGLNGIVSSTTTPVIWAGGEMVDLQYDKLQTPSKIIPAKFLIRADGTGYAAGNTVKFQSSEVTVGSNDQVSLNKNGLQLKDTDGNVRMMLTNQSITTDADILSAPRTVASDPVTLSSTYSGTNPQNTSATVIEANLAKGDEWGIMISSTPSQLSLAYKMTIEVYRKATDDDSDDTLVLSATATSAAGVAKVNTAYTADADGDYYIIAKIVGTGTASGDMKDYTMTFNVFVALSLDFGTNNLQGTNGVFVSFGSSAFILRSDLALMRTGRGGIRVIDGDVQIQKDGKTWKSL
jgi:hypothetical protein